MQKDCPSFSDTPITPDIDPGKRTVPAGAGIELFHSIPDPVLVVTPQGAIVEVNLALLRAIGRTRDEVVGRGVCEIIHGGRWPHIKCPLEEFLLTREARVEDTRLPGLGGEYSLTIVPVREKDLETRHMLLIARKLTRDEVRKVDTIRTAQLAAIGELAAGVAHEVNNPINGIINYAQLLIDETEDNTLQSKLLHRIVQEGERIATIIYSLLSFAREDGNELTWVDLNEVVRASLSLVQHQMKNEGIIIETDYHEPSSLIRGNFLQMQQVVLNLLSNSRYALNERYREPSPYKRIRISCRPVELEGQAFIRLSVQDWGTGIPQGILEKLFEPFFTSKPAGQGSGLGLSISYGIIKNHHGRLRVDSMLNKFTEMIIEIPAADV
jgi:PAS domain S-box-containing protein